MAKFNSLQDLWSYCMYCPFCKEMSRTISVSIGPDYSLEFISSRKSGKILHINSYARVSDEYNHSHKYNSKILIDCISNTYVKTLYDLHSEKIIHAPVSGYIQIYSHCKQCDSFVNSYEINFYNSILDLSTLKIENEHYIINSNDEEFSLNLRYDLNKIEIIKRELYENDSKYKKPILSPIFNLNFNNIDDIIKRIKTILIFS